MVRLEPRLLGGLQGFAQLLPLLRGQPLAGAGRPRNRGGTGKKTYGAGKTTTARILATLLAPMPTMPGCWATA
jgi:hypothetical protein